MRFRYTAYDKTKRIKGEIEASSIEEAKSRLTHLVLIDIRPTRKLTIHLSKKANKKELAKLFNVLGHYLKASIPLASALNLTKNQLESTRLIRFVDYLLIQIKEGQSLYNALESQNFIRLPRYIVNSIKIGEESGKLDRILLEMAKFLQEEEKIASKTIQALIYPLFIVGVSIFMISFMLTTVVPKIVKVFTSLHQELPSITRFVIESGHFVQENIITLIASALILITSITILYKKSAPFRLVIDTALLRLPIIKNIILSKELGRFSYLTYILTNSGITYVNAINLATTTIENSKLKKIFENALKEVVEGKRFSTALVKARFSYDQSFLQSLALAEETGEIGDILQSISDLYMEENEARINTLLSLLEPMLIIFVGGTIGFIVTALLLPMFRMNILH